MLFRSDTTRARPETVKALYSTAIELGARRLCVCDTVGHATPQGTRAVVKFVRELADQHDKTLGVDWHGHRDRDLGIANCLAAIEAGADRGHGTALGVGERAGNAACSNPERKLNGAIGRPWGRPIGSSVKINPLSSAGSASPLNSSTKSPATELASHSLILNFRGSPSVAN